MLAEATQSTMVIFDNELSPGNIRALEEIIGLPVLDRSALILDIFAQRAKTQGRPASGGAGAVSNICCPGCPAWVRSLSRQGGGIGTRGPGETKLESDRRHIRERINRLEEELEQVRKVRSVQRERRMKNSVPVVAIVGYTNAGKSTLLNQLTGAGIPANNRLFDTLDTTSRLSDGFRQSGRDPFRHRRIYREAAPPSGGRFPGDVGGTGICRPASARH